MHINEKNNMRIAKELRKEWEKLGEEMEILDLNFDVVKIKNLSDEQIKEYIKMDSETLNNSTIRHSTLEWLKIYNEVLLNRRKEKIKKIKELINVRYEESRKIIK